jgi:hypothetical protein
MPRQSYLWATMDFPDPAGPHVDQLRYIVCARSEVVVPGDSDTIAITARDIFPDPV